MNIKVLEKKQERITFMVKGINETIANTIRRSIQEVPVLAIDLVEFVKNDSALYDEFIANRLGLVPLKTEKGLKLPSECTCKGKGCSKCMVKFKMSSKGPAKVYSSDLKSPSLIVYKNLPIVDMVKDQELELNAYAKLGIGKEHAKFSPGLMYYKPVVEIDTSSSCDGCEACIKECPLNLLELKDKKLTTKQIEKCDLCEACVEACKKQGKDAIKLKVSKEDFIFVLESWGQLSNKEVLAGISKSIADNLNSLEKQINKLA